jgi:hypothetical protein
MTIRCVLYFTADEHAVYRSTGRGLELDAKFQTDDAGVEAFREYLKGRRGALFYLLADLMGEDFHEDQIPYLRGGDREAILQRRIAQRYRDTRLAAALSLGQVISGERRNERLLLASFTNTQQFVPWLDALETAGARLAGVYSAPLLAPALASKLKLAAPRCLVVTANRSGLRQSFVEDGRLRFARLERTVEMPPESLALFVRSETLRLLQYLATLRTLPKDGAPVQVLVVAPQGQRALFEQTLISDARLVFRTVDLDEAKRAIGLTAIPPGALAEALYLHLAVKKPPREQFASREERRRFLVWQLQRGVIAAGALGFAACALVGGSRWLEAMDLRDRAAAQRQQAAAAADEYQRITATFPVTQTSTENLKLAVVEFRRIAQLSSSPERAFVHVSQVLEQFPQFDLDSLVWSVGRPGEARDGGAPPAAAASRAPAAPAATAEDQAVTLEVSGRVNATQRNDYRGITAQVQRFATALGSSGGYELVRTQLPFDITSEGTLTGDIGASGGADNGEAPRFTITLRRKLP